MLFNSIQFVIFLPFVILIFYILPAKYRYLGLLIASYYFYMCWNVKYTFLLFMSTFITYMSGILIEKTNKIKMKKVWVTVSFLLNLSILIFFKYFNFILESINVVLDLLEIQFKFLEYNIILPVGISFYIFQALSYTMDVYRGEIKAEKNMGKYALFVSFFPQLVAGPIERSKNLLNQINNINKFNYKKIKNGFLLSLWGFFQKIVIADRLAILVNEVYGNYEKYEGFQIFIATVFFAIQIYCDFAGYSNIAIGVAQMMGFQLMQNFKQPYFSKSVAEFWRRWHISLSSWFKDYLYIPLGGNKKGKIRKYMNIMIVFLISGFWHGANWTYILWGGG
ncbi:MBOAT family O-acyltransferase [Lachnospiraceae bacterium 56-18]